MSEARMSIEPYAELDPSCAVVAVTPPGQAYMHTYLRRMSLEPLGPVSGLSAAAVRGSRASPG